MLWPVKTRKMLAIERPITPAKARKAARAEAVLIRSIRNEKNITNASGANITSHLSGVLKRGP
jgi:hypothetical protein